jgi:hypothetical protein
MADAMTADEGLTDEQCDAIRKACIAENRAATGGGSQRAIMFQRALIRAGAAAAMPREPRKWADPPILHLLHGVRLQLREARLGHDWLTVANVEEAVYAACLQIARDAAPAVAQPAAQDQSGDGAMCSVGSANITGVATGSRNDPASESVPSPDPAAKADDDLLRRLDMIYDTDEIRNGYRDVRWQAAAAIRALQAENARLRNCRQLDSETFLALDKAETQRDRMQAVLDETVRAMGDSIIRVEAERDAALADAERYRWLRPRLFAADFAYSSPPIYVINFKMPEDFQISGNLDAAIDAARKEAK